MAKLAFQQ